MDATGLPTAEFAFPGPLRDQLVNAIVRGAKTSTTSLLQEYLDAGEALPGVGTRQSVVDSDDTAVAVIEVVAVELVRLAEVSLDHVIAEGEGHTTVADWRAGHERFWGSAELRAELTDPTFTVTDETVVVLERFRLVP